MRSTAMSPAAWAGLLVLYVVWGSTYLGMKVAIDTMPPLVMGVLRFIPAGVLLAAGVVIHARGRIPRLTTRGIVDASIVGTMLLLGGTGLVAWSEQTIPTGIAALMVALTPMWLAIFGRVLFGDRVPLLAGAGILVGLGGVAILAWPTGEIGSLDPAGLLALGLAPMAWSLGTLYAARRAVLPAPALLSTAIQMIAAGLAFAVATLVTGDAGRFSAADVGTASWLGIGYLVVVGSLVGYTTYAWLLTVAPLGRLATYAYVNPVVAVALGWLILGETLSIRAVVASIVIVVAVALIVTARGRATAPARREPVARRAAAGPGDDPAPPGMAAAPEPARAP